MFPFAYSYNIYVLTSNEQHIILPFNLLQTYLEAAKTQLIRGYKGLPASKITSTVGQNVGAITYGGIKLNFWDLGGQEELQPLWEKVGPTLKIYFTLFLTFK